MKNCYRIAVVLFLGMPLPASADETLVSQHKIPSAATSHNDFHLSVLVDFIDDALEIHYTPEKIEQMMTIFKQIGIRRVYWQHYGGLRANWGFWNGHGSTAASRATIHSLGGTPIKVAVEKAKQAGLEIYAVIRPYENGISETVPAGSPAATANRGVPRLGGPGLIVMDFLVDHPEMRIQRRMSEIPDQVESIPICRIKLFKNNDASTRIDQRSIEIWTSDDNYRYTKQDVSFSFSQTVEPADRDFVAHGKVRTPAGTPIRVLTLDQLNLNDKYVLVTTSLTDKKGDFQNRATEIIRVYDQQGSEIPITIATSYSGWQPNRDFRTYGLSFDTAHGSNPLILDLDNTTGIGGFVAVCRGKNMFLPGALCAAYPEVQDYWMDFVEECVDAGVDGIDMRVQNHSTWTDEPFAYGFNPPIVDAYKQRYGVDIVTADYDLKQLADLRGEYYTAFLRSTGTLLHSKQKKLQVHINTDLLSPEFATTINPFTYPRNITFDWQQWLSEGIVDEATLRSLVLGPNDIANHKLTQHVIQVCCKLKIPLHYNRYLTQTEPTFEALQTEINTIHDLGAFRSFILYEGKRLVGADGDRSVKQTGGRYGTQPQWKQLLDDLRLR